MKLVSSQTEKQRQAAEAERKFERRLKELAANIMRVTRGAGRPEDVVSQILSCMETLQAHHDAGGSVAEINAGAMLRPPERSTTRDDYASQEWEHGVQQVVDGALQVAASDLLDQATQRSAGERQLHDGVRAIERSRIARALEQGDDRAHQVARAERAEVKRGMAAAEEFQREVFGDRLAKQMTGPDGKPAKGSRARLAVYKAARGIE